MPTRKTRKLATKTGIIGLRVDDSLKALTDQVIKYLGITKTEFFEQAIKDKIRGLANENPEIKKMVEATIRQVSVID